MVSAVLSDSNSPFQWRKRGLDITVYVGVGGEGEGEKRKKIAILFFKWLISFLSNTKQNFNDETCQQLGLIWRLFLWQEQQDNKRSVPTAFQFKRLFQQTLCNSRALNSAIPIASPLPGSCLSWGWDHRPHVSSKGCGGCCSSFLSNHKAGSKPAGFTWGLSGNVVSAYICMSLDFQNFSALLLVGPCLPRIFLIYCRERLLPQGFPGFMGV